MWGLVLSLALVVGFVEAAARRPERQRRADEAKLQRLRLVLEGGRIDLDQAEDGAVLARRMGNPALEQSFKKKAASLKKQPAGRT